MKKLIGICLLCLLACVVMADEKVFPQLGKYKNVRVTGITWVGIRIVHSDGNCYITDKDLNEKEKALLQDELESWREKAEKHQKRKAIQDKYKAQQEKDLQDFIKRVPKMSAKDIVQWFGQRIGTNPSRRDCKEKFFLKYSYAGNASKAWTACDKRLEQLDTANFNKLTAKCSAAKNMAAVNSILKREVGAAYGTPAFLDRLNARFPWAKGKGAFMTSLANKIKAEKAAAEAAKKCSKCKKNPPVKPGGTCKSCQ